MAYVYGQEPGAEAVTVRVAGQDQTVPAGIDGWWVFLAAAGDRDEPPYQVGHPRPVLAPPTGEVRIAG